MPEADVELLAAAAVALNEHAPMLFQLGLAFHAAGHEFGTPLAVPCGTPCWAG